MYIIKPTVAPGRGYEPSEIDAFCFNAEGAALAKNAIVMISGTVAAASFGTLATWRTGSVAFNDDDSPHQRVQLYDAGMVATGWIGVTQEPIEIGARGRVRFHGVTEMEITVDIGNTAAANAGTIVGANIDGTIGIPAAVGERRIGRLIVDKGAAEATVVLWLYGIPSYESIA